MPWIEPPSEESLLQQYYARAVQDWCDMHGARGRIPESEDDCLVEGRGVPLGRLVDHLNNGPKVKAAWMSEHLRNTFDYHGMPLADVDCVDGVRRVYMRFDAASRPSGWEDQLVHELDTHFASNPGVWPDPVLHESLSRLLSEMQRPGLNLANWSRMPAIGAAFARHGIPTAVDRGQVTVDRNAYQPQVRLRFDPARTSVAALAGQRRPRSEAASSPSDSSFSATTQERPAQRRRRR
ncbi:hypothetical protein [Streptomyces sp. NPDC006012]|uniref:hypothetical protein n=1 Tax=Streptomyces sp. NPDC006012 TaxID=3364739 RepID=UPI00368DDA44